MLARRYAELRSLLHHRYTGWADALQRTSGRDKCRSKATTASCQTARLHSCDMFEQPLRRTSKCHRRADELFAVDIAPVLGLPPSCHLTRRRIAASALVRSVTQSWMSWWNSASAAARAVPSTFSTLPRVMKGG